MTVKREPRTRVVVDVVAACVLNAASHTVCVTPRVSGSYFGVFWKDFEDLLRIYGFWIDLDLKAITVGQDPIEKAVVNIG